MLLSRRQGVNNSCRLCVKSANARIGFVLSAATIVAIAIAIAVNASAVKR